MVSEVGKILITRDVYDKKTFILPFFVFLKCIAETNITIYPEKVVWGIALKDRHPSTLL